MNANEFEQSLNELGADVVLEESQAAAEARRRRVVAKMQRVNVELVREGQKVRWLRWGVGAGLVAGAAAAVALLVLGPLASGGREVAGMQTAANTTTPFVPLRTEMTQGSVTRVAGKAKERLGLGDSLVLAEAQVLETQEGSHARVHGGRGLDIDVGPGSRVVVGAVEPTSGAANIRLVRGLVNCSVDPAGKGPKLSVVTPDATVVVKGTIFSVEVTEEEGTSRSCVRVQRGWVTVNRRGKIEQVRAGESSGCETATALEDLPHLEEDDSSAALATDEVAGASATNAAGNVRTPNGAGLPSLALQNSLLARALASERMGELTMAESQLNELLQRFPSTPLRVDAEAARARIRTKRAELRP